VQRKDKEIESHEQRQRVKMSNGKAFSRLMPDSHSYGVAEPCFDASAAIVTVERN
jgi:hypothetical protein